MSSNAAAPAVHTTPAQPSPQMTLPILVFGLPEVRRLKLELESLDDYMRQSAIRSPGQQPALPRMSRMCEGLATENHLNLLQEVDRKRLQLFLVTVETQAPSIHMSFAADPSSAFVAKLVSWLRTSIHPYALLQIGLQPTIAAGCIVRTPNKEFDFSLRQRLSKRQDALLQAFEAEFTPAAPPAAAAPADAPVITTTAPPIPTVPAISSQGATS